LERSEIGRPGGRNFDSSRSSPRRQNPKIFGCSERTGNPAGLEDKDRPRDLSPASEASRRARAGRPCVGRSTRCPP
jgi:hypothetical protein